MLPLWIKIYCGLLFVVIILNTLLNIRYKVKPAIIVYGVFSPLYLIFLVYAYWSPDILGRLNILYVIAFLSILIADMFFTFKVDINKIGKNMPVTTSKEQEAAKITSVLLAGPAYVIGLLVSIKILSSCLF